jgi:DnaK suppressor protein
MKSNSRSSAALAARSLMRKPTTMTKSEIDQFRRKLECNRADAVLFLERLGDETRSLDTDSPQDRGDYSVAILSKESLIQQGSERRNRVRTIDAALRRIEERTFGICLGCGDEIHSRRLHVVPWTEYCIACQETREQEGKDDFSYSSGSGLEWKRAGRCLCFLRL